MFLDHSIVIICRQPIRTKYDEAQAVSVTRAHRKATAFFADVWAASSISSRHSRECLALLESVRASPGRPCYLRETASEPCVSVSLCLRFPRGTVIYLTCMPKASGRQPMPPRSRKGIMVSANCNTVERHRKLWMFTQCDAIIMGTRAGIRERKRS